MARRTKKEKMDGISSGPLCKDREVTLEQSVGMYDAISRLSDRTISETGRVSGDLDMALKDMGAVVVHLTSEYVEGDPDKAMDELEKRGLRGIFGE